MRLCAADNVGDNVGDIAGMGADLFGSFAEATCAALVISSVSTLGTEHVFVAMTYPLLISAAGLLVCLLTTLIATDFKPARGINEIESTLKLQLIVSTVLATPVSLSWTFVFTVLDSPKTCRRVACVAELYACVCRLCHAILSYASVALCDYSAKFFVQTQGM